FGLGMILIFFLPGYAITRLFFTDRVDFDLFMLLSIGLSVISSMIIATGLALAGVLTLQSSLSALLGITLIALMADKMRHHTNRKFEVEIKKPRKEDVDPVIAIGIAFGTVLIAIFAYLLVTANPPSTTHIILMSEDGGTDLPANGTVGISLNFTFEVMNGEGRQAEFSVQTFVNGTMMNEVVMMMENEENHTLSLNATPYDSGYQQIMVKVYIDDQYYGELHFWVNVLP
ncbi:MAG: DUF1616 domain-containing protein, partial [Thermoplasmata archaeon]|nr:DUF1616 domain-containing protein [Thermoplasmata archaeon]